MELIIFTWEPAPYQLTNEAMFADVAASFVPGLRDSRFKDEGTVEKALKTGHVVSTGYRLPYLAHARLEPGKCVTPLKDGALDICAAKADPLAERNRLCRHEPSKRVLEAVGRMSGRSKPVPRRRGRGVAFTLSFSVPVAEIVEDTDKLAGVEINKVFVAAEFDRGLEPVNFAKQLKGCVIWGLGHAMNCQ